MNDWFSGWLSVMGRCQCVVTSCLVPPGGDSRERGHNTQLPSIHGEEKEGEEEEHEQKDPLQQTISTRNQVKS